MAFRGQRFDVDLSSDEAFEASLNAAQPVLPGFIKDVAERPAAASAIAPTLKATPGGFPAHKKRTGSSRFKQERSESTPNSNDKQAATLPTQRLSRDTAGLSAEDRQGIDKENREKLKNMSNASIANERRELMEGLSPSLIQRLLRRANIDDEPETQTRSNPSQESQPVISVEPSREPNADSKTPQSDDSTTDAGDSAAHPHPAAADDSSAPAMHFPRNPQPPKLDPSSPNFLTDLHDKYYPDLPHDPSKLSWMTSTDTDHGDSNANTHNQYDTAAQDLPVSALRFSFTGELLPPSKAQAIPVTKGLHHHGVAPDAAGYTIGELAHLSRSSFPTQRCIAFQTLGRILYRLGIGEFGRLQRELAVEGDEVEEEEEEEGTGLARGLWDCVRQSRVLETLEHEAAQEGGHVSAKAYAVEALWLWRKGGGTEVRAT